MIEKIRSLREKTGLGINDIKRALEEADNDETEALALLKKKGLTAAAKRSDRATSQGLIEAYTHGGGRIGALVEVSCETDFVARNDDFRSFVRDIAMQVVSMSPETVEELLAQEYFRDSAITIRELLTDKIAKIGENVKIVRFSRFELNG